MKATLTFNLPEDHVEHQNAVDAGKAFSLISTIDSMARAYFKFGGETTADELLQRIRDEIRDEFPDIDER